MPAVRKNYDLAVQMYTDGSSVEEVAIAHGLTRQAMHKILKIRDVVFRSKKRSGKENHFFVNGKGYEPYQVEARLEVMKALRSGRLKRKACEKCGFEGSAKDGRSLVHAHHEDYRKALDVKWLCVKCHHGEHHK